MADKKFVYIGRRRVGHVNGPYFIKHIRGSRHLLRTPPAICFDLESLAQAEEMGATHLAVEDTEAKRWYCLDIETARVKGFTMNRGHGEQLAVPLTAWEVKLYVPEEATGVAA